MISENQLKDTERRALMVLTEVKNWSSDELSSLQLVFAEIPEPEEGDIMQINANTIVPSRQEAELLAWYTLKCFQIHSIFQSDHEGSYKATLTGSKHTPGYYIPISPWFIGWYSHLLSVDSSIQSLVRKLHDSEWNEPEMLYRGESKEYPSVRSSLSRDLDTTSPEALSIIQKDEETRIKASRIDGANSDITGTLQHIGGKSNCIDFAAIPWVALYFACESNPTEDGIIWGYNRNQQVDGITFRKPNSSDETAKRRMDNQTSWLIEPDTGIIESQYLLKVATIHRELKPILMRFLEQANISENTMFPDLLSVVQKHQKEGQSIGADAQVHLWIERLKSGEFNRVRQEAQNIIAMEGNTHNWPRIGFYFRGLASASLGDIRQAEKDLLESRKLFDRGQSLEALEKNLNLIQAALRSKDTSRLKKRMSLEVNNSLWTITLSGYRWRGSF